jgi:1,4-dihydroxy-2-naphthoate octaprenyltransferase
MRWQAWTIAARPRTLVCSVVPVAVGSAIAYRDGAFQPAMAIAALAAAVWIQIGTNLANDVFDFEQGADTADRLGPQRAVASGLLDPSSVRWGIALSFALAALAGSYLVIERGAPALAIGAASIASGLGYTWGKRSLGYLGLGEVFVLAFFGVAGVAGTAFVMSGRATSVAFIASVPVGALATVLLAVNNLRDLATDALADKRTLAVRLGRRFAVAEIGALLLAAHASALMIGGAFAWSTLALAPESARVALEARARHGSALNDTLARAARLLLIFGLLFAAAIAWSG